MGTRSSLFLIMIMDDRGNPHRPLIHAAGSGEIALRVMTRDDIPAGMRLCAHAGWNQMRADWELFLQCSPEGCFVAAHNGRPVGTVATITYGGSVAWIGMVLVDPQLRRRGIGSLLLTRALAYLEGCPSIKLDATPAGKEVYDKLGFTDEYGLHRLVCAVLPRLPDSGASGARPIAEDSFGRIIEWDRPVFGADRGVVLAALLKNAPESAFCLEQEGILRGYCLGRTGSLYHQIGPVVAGTLEDAKALLRMAFRGLAGRAVVMDVPDSKPELQAWLETIGFARQRPFMRMVRKSNGSPGMPNLQFAIVGPELG